MALNPLHKQKYKKKGFTLIEVLLVFIIIAVIGGLAFPTLMITMERFIAREGVQMLHDALAAQKRYKIDHGSYTNLKTDLDITFRKSRYFENTNVEVNNTDPLATVYRNEGGRLYSLSILKNGTITCNDISLTDTITCSKIGF